MSEELPDFPTRAQAENAPAAPNGYDGPSDAEDPTQQYTDEMPY